MKKTIGALRSELTTPVQVYFSDILPRRHVELFSQIQLALLAGGVSFDLLLHTKDIWCRDYMPVSGASGKLVQFRYAPSYLQSNKWQLTVTDAVDTCRAIGVRPTLSDLVVDGGNLVRYGRKAIMTERVFSENPSLTGEQVESRIKELLGLEELIVIPVEPGDPFGHADGCVRFIDEHTVLINVSLLGQGGWGETLRVLLQERGLNWVDMPYFVDTDPKHKDSAAGNYINYLQVRNLILVPSYRGLERFNAQAIEVLQRVFGHRMKIVPVESTVLAKEGGVLNCVSWSPRI